MDHDHTLFFSSDEVTPRSNIHDDSSYARWRREHRETVFTITQPRAHDVQSEAPGQL